MPTTRKIPDETRHAAALLVSDRDVGVLTELIEQRILGPDGPAAERLEAELERATVVPLAELPPDVVALGSRVVFEDESGRTREVELVLPKEADAARGRVSVLAPVGSALIGLRQGGAIDWPMPGDRVAKLRIVSVQGPEAAPA